MSVRSVGIDGRVWLRGGVDEVPERLHRERCSPDGAARLEVDLVHQLPRVTAAKVSEIRLCEDTRVGHGGGVSGQLPRVGGSSHICTLTPSR